MARSRQVVALLTLFTLVVIAFGVTGFELPLPRVGAQQQRAQLQGVKAIAATTLLRVGAGAPAGGELAFMAVEPSGNLLVSDSRRASVLRFDPTGHLLTEWGPRLGNTQLVEPAGVAVTGDGAYVVMDRGMPRILRLDSSGQVQAVLDLSALSTYGLNGLAVNTAGNLYAADTGRNRVLVFSPAGQLLKQIGHAGSDLGAFTQPMMLAFAPDGSFFVSDWENGRLERFGQDDQATDAWSLGYKAFGVAVDASGRVYAADFERRRIDAFTPQGTPLGEIGADSNIVDVAPKQVAAAGAGQPSLFVLGSDGIQRIDLTNTAPPPQGGGLDSDLISVLAIVLMLLLLSVAVVTRRQRRSLLHAPLHGPVGLHAENGAQRQQQQPSAHEDLLIANQPKRE